LTRTSTSSRRTTCVSRLFAPAILLPPQRAAAPRARIVASPPPPASLTRPRALPAADATADAAADADATARFRLAQIGDFMTSQRSFTLSKSNSMSTGVYVFFDPMKGDTPSFVTNFGQIAAGDTYSFSLSYNEGDSFDGSDSNSAHQLIECSGRGQCDNAAGTCVCLPGYTGVACQRTVCPADCSGHGLCQTELRFASDGLSANLLGYTGYDSDQQYGCKCDKSYRGSDCSSSECPSGPDVLGADGGKEGMDCSGRGLCDYTTGTCQCFKGYYGERCESQTTLV